MAEVVVAGGVNWDINLFVPRFPKPGEETPIARISRGAGGKGGNVAVAAARILGPHNVGLIAVLGFDDIAQAQLLLLDADGVETSGISRCADAESGQAYIVTDESGENLIYTYFGANAMLGPEIILNHAARQMIQSSRIITIMDPPPETIETISEIAHEAGRPVAWDPGIRAVTGLHKLRRILERVSYLFLNEAEVEYMTGVREPSEAASRLSAINPNMISVLKQGQEGCTIFSRGGTVKIPGIETTKLGLSVVNTVGCGDAFLGAFSAAKALQLSDEAALRWANWAGALKATKSETRGSPTRTELEKWMTQAGTQ